MIRGRKKKRSLLLRYVSRLIRRLGRRLFLKRLSEGDVKKVSTTHDPGGLPEVVDTSDSLGFPVMKSHSGFRLDKVQFDFPKVLSIENGLYALGRNLVLTETHRIVPSGVTSANNRMGTPWELSKRPKRRMLSDGIVFRGNSLGYAHTLIEDIPRMVSAALWPERPSASRLLVPGSFRAPEEFFYQFMSDGFAHDVVDDDGILEAPYLHVPAVISKPRTLPTWFHEWVSRNILNSISTGAGRRLYISRNDAKRRRIINETEVFAELKCHGFEMIKCSELTFREQVETFASAEVVVGAHGAGHANTMFSRNHVLVECFPTPRIQPAFYLLGANLGVRYRYVAGSENSRHSDFRVDVDEILHALEGEDVL